MTETGPELAGFSGLDRTRVIGVLNVTPDSFSDAGRWLDPEVAVRHGLALLSEGADLLDVGGESTRPGAGRVDEAEELRRVVPVVRALAAAGAVVSVDTMRAGVARAAVEAGARVVNDVSGGLADPQMLATIAELEVGCVLMHWRAHSEVMASRAAYGDVVVDVRAELAGRLDAAADVGVAPGRVALDPGLGFAKTAAHNWSLLRGLDGLAELGQPLVVGASRKSFLGALLASADGEPRPTDGRDDATAALSALVARAGAWAVRVHRVRASADAVRVAAQWRHA